MTICDSCYAKNKTVKASYHTVQFSLITVGSASTPETSEHINLCFECHKELGDIKQTLTWSLKAIGSLKFRDKVLDMRA